MGESSEGGYDTAFAHDEPSQRKGRSASLDDDGESSDDDDKSGPRRARMVTSIPKRFKCSRCAKCKYQSKVRPILDFVKYVLMMYFSDRILTVFLKVLIHRHDAHAVLLARLSG